MHKKSCVVGMRTAKASALQLLPIAEFDDLAADNPASWRYFSAMALTNASVATSAADDLLIRDA